MIFEYDIIYEIYGYEVVDNMMYLPQYNTIIYDICVHEVVDIWCIYPNMM